jgi:hypothetical protein
MQFHNHFKFVILSNSKINQTFGGQPANGNVYNNQSNGVNLEHFLDKTSMMQDISKYYESDTEEVKTNGQYDHETKKGATSDHYEFEDEEDKTKSDLQFGFDDTQNSDDCKDSFQLNREISPFHFKKNNMNEINIGNGHGYKKNDLNTKPKAVEKDHRYKIPESLRKPFRDPRLSSTASVVTPMQKKTVNDHLKKNTSYNIATIKTRVQGHATNHSDTSYITTHTEDDDTNGHIEQDDNGTIAAAKMVHTTPNLANAKSLQNNSIHDLNINKNDSMKILFNLKFKPTKLYNSPYLDPSFKPSPDKVNLSMELEPLYPLIMSQHKVFEQHIKDLSNIYLTRTRIIENKKESLNLLKTNKKIPMSLCIKCELTTSPSYANHHSFIQLKEELQNEVSTFIENSSKIMERWAEINIQLLIHDRRTNILTKALQILEGLSSFYADIIGQPYWPSVSSKNITLLLLKIYLSNNYIQTDDLADHLGLPLEEILLLSAKIIYDTLPESDIKHLISNINTTDFDITDNIQKEFISEVLMNFNQIIRITTIDIWHFSKERACQSKAAQNFKVKLKSLDTLAVTAATA